MEKHQAPLQAAKCVWYWTAMVIIIGLMSSTGIGSIGQNARVVVMGSQLDRLLAQKEIDLLNWRSRLEGLLHGSGTLTPEEVNSHHECSFGKWYDSPEGQTLKQSPAFSAAGHHHEKVHTYARQVVDLFHKGEMEKAAELMKTFEKEREMLFATLDELYLA